MTTVSILMPAFNYARFLREAVDSVLAQSDPDWELVVIDDASTDETWDILQSYADPRIRSSRAERNRGLAATVNEALRRSTGDVIGVLNSDDRYRPDYLARLRGAFAEHPGIDVGVTRQPAHHVDQATETARRRLRLLLETAQYRGKQSPRRGLRHGRIQAKLPRNRTERPGLLQCFHDIQSGFLP